MKSELRDFLDNSGVRAGTSISDPRSALVNRCLNHPQTRPEDCRLHLKCTEKNESVTPALPAPPTPLAPPAPPAPPVPPEPKVHEDIFCQVGPLEQSGNQRNLTIAALLEKCLLSKNRLYCLANMLCNNELVVKYLSRCESRSGSILATSFGLHEQETLLAASKACSSQKGASGDLCAFNLSCATVSNRLGLNLETLVEGTPSQPTPKPSPAAPPLRPPPPPPTPVVAPKPAVDPESTKPPVIPAVQGPKGPRGDPESDSPDRVIVTPKTPLPGQRPEPIPKFPDTEAPF